MAKYCPICDFPAPAGVCARHGVIAGPVVTRADEIMRNEDSNANAPRVSSGGGGPDNSQGILHPDMTQLKQRRKFQSAMANQQPMIVNLDRDLQEQYLKKMLDVPQMGGWSNTPMALGEGTPYCGACGFKFENDDRFCAKCGKERRDTPEGSSMNTNGGGGSSGGENLFSQA